MPKIFPIHYRKLKRVFEQSGWRYVRTEGDHLVYEKANFVRPVVIPKYKSIPQFIILNNIRTAQMTRTEYFRLLKKKKGK